MNLNAKNRPVRVLLCSVLITFLMIILPGADVCASTLRHTTTVLQNPVKQEEGFEAILYDNTNGLPTSEANAIVQTKEGFIWIGSYSGLIRYDGKTFERIDPEEGAASAGSLYVDSRDRLWVGTTDSGAVLMEEGNVVRWNTSGGLKSHHITDIAEDSEGTIYLATTQGVAAIDADLNLQTLDDEKIADGYIEDLSTGEDGLIYGATSGGDIFTLKNGRIVRFLSQKENPVKGISCVFPDPIVPGYLYLGTENTELYYGSLGTGFRELEVKGLEQISYIQAMEYIQGNIWICGGNGVGILDSQGFHLLENVPINNSVEHIMEDYEGNLWLTSNRQGVMKIVANQFTDLYEEFGLSEEVVNTTCIYNDLLFFGTDAGLRVLDKDGQPQAVPLKSAVTASGTDLEADDLIELIGGGRVRSIIKDSRGRLWISTWRKCGLLLYDDGDVVAFTEKDGLYSDRIRAVSECRDGSMLVALTGGVQVIQDNRIVQSYGKEEGITNSESLTVCEGPDGTILLGTNGGGIFVFDEEGGRRIGLEEGLTSETIMRIKKDTVHDVYWVITSNSIAYLSPELEVTTIRDFPYTNNFDLYETSKGDLWILSSNGIYVLPSEDMIRNGEITPVYYGRANGLPCIATANSYSYLDENGNLYIAGGSCVAKVNIETPSNTVSDLKVAVPFIDADGERIYPDEEGGFTIPSGVTKVTIHGCVFNYSLVNPLVTCQLVGYDKEPVTVSRDSLAPMEYTKLPGGNYSFVMHLHDSVSSASKTLTVPIVKRKAIYEQIWFYFLSILFLIFCIAAGVSLYVNEKIRALEKKHQEEAERQRIHTELNMAAQIQASMMPHTFPPFPDRNEFDIYATMEPAKEVGGDFYDFFLIDEDHLCLVIADVSGKGIPAALFMMISKVILQSCAMLGVRTAEILDRTNEALCSSNEEQMFVTVWLGILEISTGKLTAANAGHEYPVLAGRDGRFEVVKDKHGFVIGGMDGIHYKEYEMQLEPGSKLFVYTDGLPEATDAENNMFGMDRMLEALNRDHAAAPKQILRTVRHAVRDFVQGAEQFDDLTMMCFEYKGRHSATEEGTDRN